MTLTDRESMPQPWKDTLMFCKTKTTLFLKFIWALQSLSREIAKWKPSGGGPVAAQRRPSGEPRTSHLRLGLHILAEQPLLVEGVAGLPRDGVYGALVDLLLDRTKQQEERLTHRFLQDAGGEKKLRSKLRPRILPVNLASPTPRSWPAAISILNPASRDPR